MERCGAGQPWILFSEMTGHGAQMSIVASTESRASQRTVYAPADNGMAHRSYLSPDRRQVLVVEMGFNGWLPCRLVPYDGSSAGKPVGPAPAQCTDASWSPDGKWMYFSADTGSGVHIWRQRLPGRNARAGHVQRHPGRRDSFRSRRTFVRHIDRHKPEHCLDPRFAGRSAVEFGGLCVQPVHLSRSQDAVLPGTHWWRAELHQGCPVGRGLGLRATPAAAAGFSDADIHHLEGRRACGVCGGGRKRPLSRVARVPEWPDCAAATHHDR